VLVVTTSGQLNAKAVIVTVPTGVLATGLFGFAPQLSAARREAIAQLPMALYNKIALSFGRKVIDAPAGRGITGLNGKQEPFDAIVRPHNRDAAIVFVGGAQARQLEEEGTGAALGFAMSALAEIYGNELRGLMARSSVTRWGKDPFALRLLVDGHAGQRRQAAGARPAAPRPSVLRRRSDRSGVGDARRRRLCLGRARGARGAGGAGGEALTGD
jgi:monoamine oxidase